MIMPKKRPDVFLYGTLGCHLCDDALIMGRDALPKDTVIKQIDIADDEALVLSMGNRIPVMKVGDKELNWPFEKQDVQKIWRQTSSRRRYLI